MKNNNSITYIIKTKKLILAALVPGILLMPSILQAGKTRFNPRIQKVTVYSDRALVERSAKVMLGAGKHVLVFHSACPTLDPKSIRAFSNNPAFIIQGIASRVERKIHTINPALRGLEKDMEELRKQLVALNQAKERSKQVLKGIREYYDYLAQAISQQSSYRKDRIGGSKKWEKAIKKLLDRKMKTLRTIRNTDEEIRVLNEKIGILSEKIRKLKPVDSKKIRVIEITLMTLRRARARVGFSYIIGNASWRVSYGMYLQKNGLVSVEYYGNIHQLTGEDWKDVELILSVAKPALGAQRPRLKAEKVYGRKTKTRQVIVTTDEKVKEKPGISKPGTEKKAWKAFNIKMRAHIPSAHRSHRVKITGFSTKPKSLYYRIVGMKKKAAYLAAELRNDQPFPLLSGKTDIFRLSGYIGASSIKYTPPGETYKAGFGVDNNIRVSRHVKHYTKAAGVFSSNKISQTLITILVLNSGKHKRTISIFERIPVSETSEVKLKILDKTSSGHVIEQKDSGILRWNKKLMPGEKIRIVLNYSVTAPKRYPSFLGR